MKGGLDCVGETKKFFASKMSLRTNSNTLPWKRLLPDFVMTLIIAAGFSAKFRVVGSLVDVHFLDVVHRRAQNQIIKGFVRDGHAIDEIQLCPPRWPRIP